LQKPSSMAVSLGSVVSSRKATVYEPSRRKARSLRRVSRVVRLGNSIRSLSVSVYSEQRRLMAEFENREKRPRARRAVPKTKTAPRRNFPTSSIRKRTEVNRVANDEGGLRRRFDINVRIRPNGPVPKRATATSTMIPARSTPGQRGQMVFETKILGPSPKRKHWTAALFTSITEPPRAAVCSILRR